ncbi:hypothetical protein INR49_009539 [Caranx melampygus]|nr:hypothetical protein INR49_009539 [Caranx melampygus]
MFFPTLTFWATNALLLLVDTTGKPAFITRYRIQTDKNNPVDPEKLRQALKTVTFNQVFISGPMVVICYHLMSWRGTPAAPSCPPSTGPDRAGRLLHHRGSHVLLLTQALPPPQPLQTLPQAAPRVDRPHRTRLHLRPSSGACDLQHAARGDRTCDPGLTLDHHRPLVLSGPGQHHHLPLWIPPALPALPRVPRLPPPQVQPVLRGLRGPGPAPRHRHQIQADQTVRAPPPAHQPHPAHREHPRLTQEGPVMTYDPAPPTPPQPLTSGTSARQPLGISPSYLVTKKSPNQTLK